jgi:hypothetical protein
VGQRWYPFDVGLAWVVNGSPHRSVFSSFGNFWLILHKRKQSSRCCRLLPLFLSLRANSLNSIPAKQAKPAKPHKQTHGKKSTQNMPLLARCPATCLATPPPLLSSSVSHARLLLRPQSSQFHSASRRPLINLQKPISHQFSRGFRPSPAAMVIKTYFDIRYADPSAPNTRTFSPFTTLFLLLPPFRCLLVCYAFFRCYFQSVCFWLMQLGRSSFWL